MSSSQSEEPFYLQVRGQDHTGELLKGQTAIPIFVAIFEQFSDLPLGTHLSQHPTHVVNVNVPLVPLVIILEHLPISGQTGPWKYPFLGLILGVADLGGLFLCEVVGVVLTPVVDELQMLGSQVGVDPYEQLLERDLTSLVVVEEVVQTGCDTLHVVVLLLTETLNEVLNQDGLLAARQSVKVVL